MHFFLISHFLVYYELNELKSHASNEKGKLNHYVTLNDEIRASVLFSYENIEERFLFITLNVKYLNDYFPKS